MCMARDRGKNKPTGDPSPRRRDRGPPAGMTFARNQRHSFKLFLPSKSSSPSFIQHNAGNNFAIIAIVFLAVHNSTKTKSVEAPEPDHSHTGERRQHIPSPPSMVTTRSVSRSTPSTPLAQHASPAGNALEIDPVQKARTITHMNKDHAADLAAILRHKLGLTEAEAAGAEMVDIDLAIINARVVDSAGNSTVYGVPIKPPMGSWGERRAKLVEMTLDARRALGIKEFYPPEGWGILSFVGVLWYFLSAAVVFSGNMKPGSLPWRTVETIHFPGGPKLYATLVTYLLVPMLIVHGAEAAYMAKSRLAPKGVPVGSAVWLAWVVCAFFEGAPCYTKWDRRVLGKQKSQ